MGHATYSADTRSSRALSAGYYTKSVDLIFTQQKKHMIHEAMDPKSIKQRECRDSPTHPNTLPVIIGLDVTGSMLTIPKELIKDGLPTMVSTIIQSGVPDLAILFTAFGDAECDRFPLQVGEFESGDAELDLWLTRCYLEAGGGSNAGESYHLVWDFANRFVVTDAWEKRQQKGIIITIGDEPCLPGLSKSLINEVYGENKKSNQGTTNEQMLKEVMKKWDVYHIHVAHRGQQVAQSWKDLLGQNLIIERNFHDVPKKIAELVLGAVDTESSAFTAPTKQTVVEDEPEVTEVIL